MLFGAGIKSGAATVGWLGRLRMFGGRWTGNWTGAGEYKTPPYLEEESWADIQDVGAAVPPVLTFIYDDLKSFLRMGSRNIPRGLK